MGVEMNVLMERKVSGVGLEVTLNDGSSRKEWCRGWEGIRCEGHRRMGDVGVERVV